MKSNVMIVKLNTGWMLRVTSYQDEMPVVMRYTFNRLAQAIEAANQLKLHIDNNDVLPLKQYKQVA